MAFGHTILIFCTAVMTVSSAGIIETLLSWDLPVPEASPPPPPQSKCLCQASGCICCVDLNFRTLIELTNSTCIEIKQKEQNISLNMSYGNNIIQNATIKIADAANKATCMNLLSDSAQICAKFTSVKQVENNFDRCLVLELALLGSQQATYRMGCFNFNQGVRQVEAPSAFETTDDEQTSAEDEADTLDAAKLIAAVSASAQQGFIIFTQWLGLNLKPKQNITSHSTMDNQFATTNSTSARSGRDMSEAEQERSEKNLKQLLIAQDNITKESAKIENSDVLRTTFVYPKSMKEQQSPESSRVSSVAAIVPRESRRGGRAYNIHQHINEI